MRQSERERDASLATIERITFVDVWGIVNSHWIDTNERIRLYNGIMCFSPNLCNFSNEQLYLCKHTHIHTKWWSVSVQCIITWMQYRIISFDESSWNLYCICLRCTDVEQLHNAIIFFFVNFFSTKTLMSGREKKSIIIDWYYAYVCCTLLIWGGGGGPMQTQATHKRDSSSCQQQKIIFDMKNAFLCLKTWMAVIEMWNVERWGRENGGLLHLCKGNDVSEQMFVRNRQFLRNGKKTISNENCAENIQRFFSLPRTTFRILWCKN